MHLKRVRMTSAAKRGTSRFQQQRRCACRRCRVPWGVLFYLSAPLRGPGNGPLAAQPKNFRDIVEADLRRAARLVIKVQDEIDPQFRFATPEGDYHLPVMLPADLYGRKVIFRAIALLFAWKQASGTRSRVSCIGPTASVRGVHG